MQLPRGRFQCLIKPTTSRALIEEMGSKQFTGVCTIAPGDESAVLVFNEGLVVLARCGGIGGQQALNMVRGGTGGEAAAELDFLTPEQVQLALEFNRQFVTGSQEKPSPVRTALEVDRPLTPGAKPVQGGVVEPPLEDDEIAMLIQEMEEIDVERLASSFKANCREMLKAIHLDHLIQERET